MKNKTCVILCQDKAFEDKMNCQFHSTHCKCLSFNLWKLVISTINIIQTWLKYVMCYLSFFINKKFGGKKLCVGTCLKCLTVAMPLGKKKMEGVSTITQYQYHYDYQYRLSPYRVHLPWVLSDQQWLCCQHCRSTYEIQIEVNKKVIAYLLCKNITQSLSRYQPEPK